MHLLAAKPGGFSDEEGIIDLQQTAADIVILASQDTTLSLLARVADQLPEDYPSLRLANLIHLTKPAAFDLYAHKVLEKAKVILVYLLGGEPYFKYGIEQLESICRRSGATLLLMPGDDTPDENLFAKSTAEPALTHQLWRFLREGGIQNTQSFFAALQYHFFTKSPDSVADSLPYPPPQTLPHAGLYWPSPASASAHLRFTTIKDWEADHERLIAQSDNPGLPSYPVVVLLFYRSHLQAGNLDAFDGLINLLIDYGLMPLPIALNSLKDTESKQVVDELAKRYQATLIINTTAFSAKQEAQGNAALSDLQEQSNSPIFSVDVPVLQVILAANTEEDWQNHSQGLRARDIAMNVALPEMDGRIISRAISFKKEEANNDRTQFQPLGYQLHQERARHVCELAVRWVRLGLLNNAQKRIALILANYPTKDGRIGNGVGLDTPASCIQILNAMKAAGYPVDQIPETGTALVEALLQYVTNNPDNLLMKGCDQSLSLETYQQYFQQMPASCQEAVIQRWGSPENDPKYRSGQIMIAGLHLGDTFVGIQPARGFNIDIAANYHDPDLIPPHSYLAFYFWIRHVYEADAVIHIGKHGNLEWLPGKGIALSDECWPDIALGPMPNLYPFIVNDPGEGAQAKRRIQAVILDHLMPPMTRAETYGALENLEQLVDEYYQAMNIDPKREVLLRDNILLQLKDEHLLEELQLNATNANDEDALLNALDAYLCELKEAQIRDGLHIYGQAPIDEQRLDTLIALVRLPRGTAPEEQGILHTLVEDLSLSNGDAPLFNPLDFDASEPWYGGRPQPLDSLLDTPWRNQADTKERLELLARALVGSRLKQQVHPAESTLPKTRQLLNHITTTIARALDQSAENEIHQLLSGLNAKFVPPGPSGAPTRGRLDVLPTGRNFYSVDSRSIPTPAAWEIGQASAEQLIMRHLQEEGDYPRQVGISVWGTATMRTGGDDIAQAFALMGVKPVWAVGSHRVVDFEIIPNFLMQRPRVDVTLRVSGFFRDAFPNVMHLFDAAVKALAAHEEPGDTNMIRANIQEQSQQLQTQGITKEDADKQASWRVFGSKPGAYGAGLQGLIDERCWDNQADLAEAYVNWGGYAYGQEDKGTEAFDAFEQRLGQLDAVIQNQDNREHDLLDSDDYYQFQGGMSNAVTQFSGAAPQIYHGDHANPAAPKIRTLKEELNRVIRSRALNPKWINAMQRHGYKGAFEMAATVDYLFAYDATTQFIDDYQYQAITQTYLFDEQNRQFLEQHNPNAMREMTERMIEAIQRGMWAEPGDMAQQLETLLLEQESQLEQS